MQKEDLNVPTPLVSIITPTYNHEKFIGHCIESVLSQTFSDWEQIIIDDGSTDRTPQIVQNFKDSRIRYVYQKNKGIWNLAETYNKALSLAKGKLIAILEGDDYWPPHKLEKQVPTFDNSAVVLSWGKAFFVNEKDKVIGSSGGKNFYSNSLYQNRPNGIAIKMFLFKNYLSPSVTVMVRKDTLLKIGGFRQYRGIPYVDYPTWLALSLEGEFYYLEEILGYWRRHSLQATANYYSIMMRGHVMITQDFLKTLPTAFKKDLGIDDYIISAGNSWYEGLALLNEKKWRQARKEFLNVVLKAPLSLKQKAIVAFIASFFHLNWEHVFELRQYLLKLFRKKN